MTEWELNEWVKGVEAHLAKAGQVTAYLRQSLENIQENIEVFQADTAQTLDKLSACDRKALGAIDGLAACSSEIAGAIAAIKEAQVRIHERIALLEGMVLR